MTKLAEPGITVALLGLVTGCLSLAPAFGQGVNQVEKCLAAGSAPPDTAIRECTLAMQPGQPSDKTSMRAVYLSRANAYVRKGDYDRALADYDEVIKLAPDTTI